MRPLYLKVSGIGPFVETQEIDFSLLDDRALFLIHGPTGQGKTFLFDAICYALYAETPAGREGHLKSDYLPVGIEPLIEFRFRVGESRFRVRRTLRFDRPRKRGGGITTAPETQYLARLNEEGSDVEVLAEKKSEVDRRLRDLLGLDAGQFRQVVMIPQGDFRRLLLSGSDRREELLEKLFDTSIYKGVQERIREREESGRLEIASGRANLERLKNEISDLRRSEDLSVDDTESAEAQIAEAGLLLREKADGLSLAAGKAAAALETATRDFEQARALASDHNRLSELLKEKDEIRSQSSSMEKLKVRLAQDSRALALKEPFAELDLARRAAETASNDFETSLKEKNEVIQRKSALTRRLAESPLLRNKLEILDKRIRLTERFRDEGSVLRLLHTQIEESRIELEASQVSRKKQLAAHEVLNLHRRELEEILAAAGGPGAAEDRRELIRLLESMSGLQENLLGDNDRVAELKRTLNDSQTLRESAYLELSALKSRRSANLAGDLANTLVDGEACPVCGSVHHPQPATGGDGPSQAEYDAAEHLLGKADTGVAEARALIDSITNGSTETSEKISNLETETGISISSAGDKVRELREMILRENQQRLELDELLGSLLPESSAVSERLSAQTEAYRHELESLNRKLSERVAEWNNTIVEWPGEEGEQPPGPGQLPDLLDEWEREKQGTGEILANLDNDEKAIVADSRGADAAEVVRKDQLSKAVENQKRREESFALSLVDAGFTDEAALAVALTEAESTAEDRSRFETWTARNRENSTRIEETRERIGSKPVPDLNTLENLRIKASEISADSAGRHAATKESLRRFEDLRGRIKQLENESSESENLHSLLRSLSRQVRGIDPPKISLNRFFLARRLEEVLVQATLRLSLLSRGRFTLKRRDEGKTAAAQAGLDLYVSDAWTGTERPVNTLSGGQLFMASLSLALGLADVVQARSGAVKLEALFIDEGFGTLDEEALQGVLQVLNDLRENRMVGVISHVPELKRQISDRIEVARSDPGSSLKLVIQSHYPLPSH